MRLAVPDLVSNSYFPAVAAVELGFFRAEGLDVTLEHLFPIPRTMETLRDGGLDFVAGPAHAVLTAFPSWEGAKLIVALAQRTYWLLILRSDLGVQQGDVQAIKGLRIGAAPGPDLALKRLLQEEGIDLESDGVKVGPVPTASGPGVSFGVHAAQALEEGIIDGFWANAMGSEVAVRNGVGTVVLDVRRDIGPAAAQHYTFPALVTTESLIARDPNSAAAAVRAIVKTQQALREDVSLATTVGERLFPAAEAAMIADLVRRDLPYYNPVITEASVAGMDRFAQDIGLLSANVPYEEVVATRFADLWGG